VVRRLARDRRADPADRGQAAAALQAIGIEPGWWFDDVVHPKGSVRYGYLAGDCPHGEALAPVKLDLDFDKAFSGTGSGSARVGAYERLLLDAIAGKLNLFVRSDEQEQAWRWVEPILKAWSASEEAPRPYNAGSWGPAASSAMVARDGFTWPEEV